MTSATPSPRTFLHFSALAAELRNEIWHEALPKKTERALAFWKLGCWRLRGAEPRLFFEFRHDRLETHVEKPLAFVNREARSIALPLIHEQGLRLNIRGDLHPIFVRSFDYMVDVLYLGPGQLMDIMGDSE